MKRQRVSKGIHFFVPSRYEDNISLEVRYRALSHKELLGLTEFLDTGRHNQFSYEVCKVAIIDIENSLGEPLKIKNLSPEVIKEIATEILEASSVTEVDLDKLNSNLNITFDSKFKTETWDCVVWKAKRLDRVRNCGFRNEKDKNPDFSVLVGNQPYKYCPIYDVEPTLLNNALECYAMYDKNLLPDAGGLYDQTRFFVTASSLIDKKIMEEQQKEMKKNKQK